MADDFQRIPAPAPAGHGAVSIDTIAQTILRYVADRPHACDTVEGIAEWWIPRQRLVEARADVLSALATLTGAGRLETLVGADGRVLYRAARGSLGERLDG